MNGFVNFNDLQGVYSYGRKLKGYGFSLKEAKRSFDNRYGNGPQAKTRWTFFFNGYQSA